MTRYAASSLAYTSVSKAHGGCGQPHSRPVEHGAPAKIWALTCAPCENFLRDDPMWSATLSEIPETYDEKLTREDFEKRRVYDQQGVMAIAMAKMAGVELPETLRQPLSAIAPHVAAITGTVVCDAGHDSEPGSKFCGECGIPLRVSGKRTCPAGHEMAAKAKFCGECGQLAAGVRALEAPAAAPRRRLKDMRAEELRAMARDRGVDASGSRAQVLARLQAA